jgi:multiple antibiotic resistance protein
MSFDIDGLITITFTLFAVIDIIGSVPLLISLKEKMGGIREARATLISGGLMILFLVTGEKFLSILGLDVKSFAVGGSVVIFIGGWLAPEVTGLRTRNTCVSDPIRL